MPGKVGGATSAPVWVRFWTKVDKTGWCWNWTGAVNDSGYGVIWDGYHLVYAHRLSYVMAGLAIDETDVDHRCGNKVCVRPDHLQAVTHLENVKRAVARRRMTGTTYVRKESEESHRRRSEAAKRRWARQRGEAA